MRMKRGSTRWLGRAKIPRAPRAAHSNSPRPSETPKLMFAACVGDAELGEDPLEVRVVAVVEDDEAGVDVDRRSGGESRRVIVFVWPPA